MPLTVLVVDDHQASAELLIEFLHADHFCVVTAPDGESALRIAQAERPAVVLLDVRLPDLSGVEVCRQLRAIPILRDATIIMVTAVDDRQTRHSVFAAGADGLLLKPFDRVELSLRLRTVAKLNRFRRLAEERTLYNDLARLMNDAVLGLDRDGRVVSQNGYSSEWLDISTGSGLERLFPDDARDRAHSQWMHLWSGSDPIIRWTSPIRTRSGDQVDVEATLGRFSIIDGQQVAALVLRDLSHYRTQESAVQALQRNEASALAYADIAHDIANYLLATEMAIHQAKQILESEPDAVVALARASDIVQDTAQLVRSLLRSEPTTAADSVGICVQQELDAARPLLAFLAHPCLLQISASGAPRSIGLSSAEFMQVLTNLITNARDASDDQRPIALTLLDTTPSTATDNPAGAASVSIRVADQGRGMTPEEKAQMFDPYFTTKKASGGTGLGLSNVLRIVTRHGGTITVSSQVDAGTSVVVGFPIRGHACDTRQPSVEPGA